MPCVHTIILPLCHNHPDVCAAINVSALTDTIIATERYDKLFGSIPGSSVTFGCEEGSTVVVESIYCLSHGNWSAKPPFCSRGKVLSLYNASNKHLQFLKSTCIKIKAWLVSWFRLHLLQMNTCVSSFFFKCYGKVYHVALIIGCFAVQYHTPGMISIQATTHP